RHVGAAPVDHVAVDVDHRDAALPAEALGGARREHVFIYQDRVAAEHAAHGALELVVEREIIHETGALRLAGDERTCGDARAHGFWGHAPTGGYAFHELPLKLLQHIDAVCLGHG